MSLSHSISANTMQHQAFLTIHLIDVIQQKLDCGPLQVLFNDTILYNIR